MFSVQELVSCDTDQGGCNGGDPYTTFDWIAQVGGLVSWDSYPYTSGNTGNTGTCQVNPSARDPSSVPKNTVYVESYSTTALTNAITQQPVVTMVDASSSIFQFYVSGKYYL